MCTHSPTTGEELRPETSDACPFPSPPGEFPPLRVVLILQQLQSPSSPASSVNPKFEAIDVSTTVCVTVRATLRPNPALTGRSFYRLPVSARVFRGGSSFFPPFKMYGETNLVAIVILSRGKCGLSGSVTCYVVGMAVADLLVVFSDVLLRWTVDLHFPPTFLYITPVCCLKMWLIFAVTVTSVWLTVAFTFDRFLAICYENLKAKYCTERTAAVVIGTVSVLSCLETTPWGIIYEPIKVVGSIPWGCALKQAFMASPVWSTFDMFHRILTPCVPFFLILLLNTLTVKRILVASRVRRLLRGCGNVENEKDPEMENRRRSIVLLFSISGSFLLLWVTQVVFYFYRRISKEYVYSAYDPRFITENASGMLQLLGSCTNTCIYTVTQSKFREELKNAVKYPLRRIRKLVTSGE
ncbi:probable G-protein coupled receptor 139 [Narcine bancroftii]|uniref:probable G-protein coupled receptor 139 n=1 Tax=Narcine bancroftii TaxID=1343680 RepID=UPI0038315588